MDTRPLMAAARRRTGAVVRRAQGTLVDLGSGRSTVREVEQLRARIAELGAQARPDGVRPVYGATRYSVFSPGAKEWQLSQGASSDPEAYMRSLWAPERMEVRERIFLEWAVPIYQAFYETHGYRHVVQHSPQMPARWLDSLRDAASTYPVLALLPDGHDEARTRWFAEDIRRRGIQHAPVAWLRVDDDDLLSTDYLDRLLEYVTEAHAGWCVSFGRGITAEYHDGRLGDLGTAITPMVSMGQAFVGLVDPSGITWPPPTSHVRVHRAMPTILDSRETAYLRVLHEHQDRNTSHQAKNPTAAYDPGLAAQVERRFPSLVGHLADTTATS